MIISESLSGTIPRKLLTCIVNGYGRGELLYAKPEEQGRHLVPRVFILKLQTARIRNNECYQSVAMLSRSRAVAGNEKPYKPFSQPQHIVVGRVQAHPVAGEPFVYYPSPGHPPK
jgi:hypothetical protein